MENETWQEVKEVVNEIGKGFSSLAKRFDPKAAEKFLWGEKPEFNPNALNEMLNGVE